MPRKQELPAVKVLEYFGTAPYDAVVLVLQLATVAVRMRAPKVAEKVGKKGPSAQQAVEAATRSVGNSTTTGTGTTGQAAPASPRPRRRAAAQTTAASPAADGTTTAAPAGQTDGLPGMAPLG